MQAAREKEKRTAMHRHLKTHFPSLTSQTVEEVGAGASGEVGEEGGGERAIRVWHRRGEL